MRKSLVAAFFQNYAEIAINLVSSIVIARLLTPAEIGVYSVAAVLMGIAQTLRHFGVSQYIVQARELDDATIRAAFGVTLVLAWSLALLIFAGAQSVAAFFREPGVRDVMHVLGVAMLLVPFGSMTMAWHYRQMNFGVLAQVGVGSTLATAIASMALASAGWGYLSLAWGSIAGVATGVVLAHVHRPPGLPRWPAFAGAGKIVAFGSTVTVSGLLTQLNGGIAELAIGRTQTMQGVGLFGRAQGTVEIFHKAVLDGVLEVAFPHFARQVRGGIDVSAGYLAAAACLTAIGWPFFACLAILARPVILVLFGPQWDDAVPLAQILCAGGAIAMALPMAQAIMLASGRAADYMWLQFQVVGVKVAAVAVAAPYGLTAVAVAWSVATPFGLCFVFRALRRLTGITAGTLWRALRKSAVLSLVTAAPVFAVFHALDAWAAPHWVSLLAGAAVAAPAWLAGVLLARHPLRAELLLLAARLKNRD